MAQFTTVSVSEVFAAKRLDARYFIALHQARASQVEGVSTLDHLKATLTTAQAQDLLEALPPAMAAKILAPLADATDLNRKASSLVHHVGQRHPHEALVLVLDQIEQLTAEATVQVEQAQTVQASVAAVAQARPRARRP